MKKIVAGNWKMNFTLEEARQFCEALALNLANFNPKENIEVVIFPSFPFLESTGRYFQSNAKVNVGGQNCSEHHFGAYTGEVSAQAIASVGGKMVLVGHSERRQYFNETSAQLLEKIKRALEANLVPVYCFGENLTDRKSEQYFQVVESQLEEVLEYFSVKKTSEFILAYEPVWAIGTGETATGTQAQQMHQFVRELMRKKGLDTTKIPILYGGSCKSSNASELFSQPDVDGGLIGGASLNAKDFTAIINVLNQQ